MPLQFIFGPSGAGKSHYLYNHIIGESRRCPDHNYIVLVPEQFTMQTQKDIVTIHPDKGIMNIDVLSFARLAYRVFEETGGGSLPVLDDEGKNLILRKIAGDYESQLKMLRGNMKKLGYISEVKSVISEFTQYDIGEEEIERMMEAAGKGSRLYYKLQDMELIYCGFTEYLQEKYITKEELLDVLRREAGESALLRNSTVVLDGFTGFTPVQVRLLQQLMKCCHDIQITVTMDDREDPFTYAHPYQLFGISKQMVSSLTKAAKEAGVSVRDPVYLYEAMPYRFRGREALAFLERNLFRHGGRHYDGEQSCISVHAAQNPKEECFLVAGRIQRVVRTQGYRYMDVGIIVSSMDIYADYLKEALRAYDIPFFIDHKRSILLNSFVEYIRSVLNMAEQGFTYESVFRFLRTDMSGYSNVEVDQLENYVIGLGIRGYKGWQARWVRRLKGMEEEDLQHLNHLRTDFIEKLDGLMFVLRQRKKTVNDITLAVYEYLVREESQRKLKQKEEEFQSMGELSLAKEYAQIYRIVIELFDKFAALLGEEQVGLNEYCKLLDAGLEEARVGVIPPSVDQVVAGDVQRTRLKDIKALFFVGANDACLPGVLGRCGLLSEQDRKLFQKEKLTLSPGGKEKAYIQKFYLYMNLTKPSELLAIYYSKVSLEGKSTRPAYVVSEIKKLYPSLLTIDEENTSIMDRELTEKSALTYLIKGLQNFRIQEEDTWKELYSWYKKSKKWQSKLVQLLDAEFASYSPDRLTKAVAKRLYGESFEESVTRMEKFASCAYAHFLVYGLELKERQEYDFRPIDLGNICHTALEKYARRLEAEEMDWNKVEEEKRKEWIADCVEEAAADYGNSVLYSTSRNEYMIKRMKRLMQTTVWALTRQLEAGDFKPSGYELRFSNGKIDRVDICEDGDRVYVKVLDYKTGAKAFDIVSLYHGLQLQLMVYMDAALHIEQRRFPEKEAVPAGVFYYRIQEPLVDKEVGESVQEELLKNLRPDGLINLREDSLFHLDKNRETESLAIPVKYNKNGSLAKGSKGLPQEEFRMLMEYAVKKVGQARDEILSGNAQINPYRKGQETGCDYCRFGRVCGFDAKIPGYSFRDIGKMSKEDVLAVIREEANK